MSIPASTPLGFLGTIFVLFGFFLILEGNGIIKIKRYIRVTRGIKTKRFGKVCVFTGGILLFAEAVLTLRTSANSASTEASNPSNLPREPVVTTTNISVLTISTPTYTPTVSPVPPTNTSVPSSTVIPTTPPPQSTITTSILEIRSHKFPEDGSPWPLPNGPSWVCTGDLFLVKGQNLTPLFNDTDAKIGSLLLIEANSGITLGGPQGGYCEATSATQEVRNALVDAKLSIMKSADTGNCEGRCASVHVKEIDKAGYIIDRGLK